MTETDYALHRKVAEVSRLVVQVAEQVGHVSGQVTAVEAGTQQTRTELQQLRDEFRAFVDQARLTAALQRAETKVGVIQDRRDLRAARDRPGGRAARAVRRRRPHRPAAGHR
ncbi:hypothetical protein ACWD0G_30060, partial [Streptomyces goshikiensis]